MIKLFQPPPAFNAANPSPFCIKLEVLLKMADIPYEIIVESDPRNGPTGKIPFIEVDGALMGDSGLIQNFLEAEKGANFHTGLSETDKAISLAFTRLIEEHTYLVLLYSRWFEDANWPVIRDLFFGALPIPLRWFVPNMIRKKVKAGMVGHGIARLPRSSIYQIGSDNLAALAAFVGDKPFAFGEAPTALDATLYGLLSGIIDADFDTPLKRAAVQHPNLVAHTARMRAKYFPELT